MFKSTVENLSESDQIELLYEFKLNLFEDVLDMSDLFSDDDY